MSNPSATQQLNQKDQANCCDLLFLSVTEMNKNCYLSTKQDMISKMERTVDLLPLSLSDLFSCSVSVRVSTELERLDRQELLPDDLPRPPRPHRCIACSGDMTAWLSVSSSWAVPTEKPRWGGGISGQKGRPRRDGGSQIPSWRRLKCWPETDGRVEII